MRRAVEVAVATVAACVLATFVAALIAALVVRTERTRYVEFLRPPCAATWVGATRCVVCPQGVSCDWRARGQEEAGR